MTASMRRALYSAVYQLLTFMGSYLIPTSLDGIFQLLTSIWLMFMQLLFYNSHKFSMGLKSGELAGQSNTCTTLVRGNSHTMLVWILQSAVEQDPAGR